MKRHRKTKHEWGVVLLGLQYLRDVPALLGFAWFESAPRPVCAAAWPARFSTRAAAREAIAARHAAGYFAGRFRVVRLTSTFQWVAP